MDEPVCVDTYFDFITTRTVNQRRTTRRRVLHNNRVTIPLTGNDARPAGHREGMTGLGSLKGIDGQQLQATIGPTLHTT